MSATFNIMIFDNNTDITSELLYGIQGMAKIYKAMRNNKQVCHPYHLLL